MATREYTIIVVPHAKAELRKFHLSTRVLSYVFIALAALFLCALGTIVYFYQQTHTVRKFEEENAQLRANLERSEVLTQQLTRKLSSLTSLSNRLKAMAGVPQLTSRKRSPKPGMGGVSVENSRETDPVRLMELRNRAAALEKNLTWLRNYFYDRNLTPSIMPAEGYISSRFGMRKNPFTSAPDFHQGIDITNNVGTPVLAAANGVVIFAGYRGTSGQLIEIEHGDEVVTIYGHLAKILVSPGQRVRRGQQIGLMGNSGMSTGPHLHYEVRVGNQPVNPKTYMDPFSG